MPVTSKAIIPARTITNSQTTQYTASTVNNTTTIIDKFTATNFSGSSVTLSVNLVTKADTAGNQNLIVKTRTLAAGETYLFPEVVGHILNPGDFISTIASAAASVNIRASGREIT